MKRIICLLLKTLEFAADSIPECNLPADGRTVRCLPLQRLAAGMGMSIQLKFIPNGNV